MIVVISPAKTLDFESPLRVRRHSEPDFLDESQRLVTLMRKKSPRELKKLMGISDKLAELNVERFDAWDREHTAGAGARQAVLAFMGDVYTGLDAQSLSSRDLDFAQKHLRILSGLYGVLRPLDLMHPYRLEMGTPLRTPRGKDLYRFWGARIAEVLNEQARALRTRHLVNLASHEYFKAVDPGALELEVVTPVFKERKGGDYRVLSFFAKKARGMMARFIIEKRLRRPAQLEAFDVDGYAFNASMSTPDTMTFTRDP